MLETVDGQNPAPPTGVEQYAINEKFPLEPPASMLGGRGGGAGFCPFKSLFKFGCAVTNVKIGGAGGPKRKG